MNPSPSARLRPFRPQPFGRYTLLSHLATGGMGDIYLARLEGAQGFEKLCVIKKILPQLAEDAEFVERFVGEARTLVKLSHGSIAQVLDMGLHEGEAYMALEYVDGKDLRKVASRGRDRQMPLPLTFTLYVTSRVLDALAYAHRKRDDDEQALNLVHRDISPQNILISYEGEVKVIDFGLAKSRLSAAKTNPSIILGKFLYMSPEQARHQPVDRRSDLYAVGLCLYELISGKNPFDVLPPGELMPAVAHPDIAPLQEVEPLVPPAVAQLVMKALAVDPADRFQTAEEFRGRVLACLLDIDPGAGPEAVSRFMHDVFSAEYQQERKLLAGLKEVPRHAGAESARAPAATSQEVPASAGRPLAATLTMKAVRSEAEPLSFQPTPRAREGGPAREEGATRPGVRRDESTRPGFALETLDAAARARLRPSGPDAPPSPTVEVRAEAPAPPAPPSRVQALTVEMPLTTAALAQSAVSTGMDVPWEQTPTVPRPSEPPRPAVPPRAAPREPKAAELSRAYAATIQLPTVSGPPTPSGAGQEAPLEVDTQPGYEIPPARARVEGAPPPGVLPESDTQPRFEVPRASARADTSPSPAGPGESDTQPRYEIPRASVRQEGAPPRVTLESARVQDDEVSASGRTKTPARRSRPPSAPGTPAVPPPVQTTASTTPSLRSLQARSMTPQDVPARVEDARGEDEPEVPAARAVAPPAAMKGGRRGKGRAWVAVGLVGLLVGVAAVALLFSGPRPGSVEAPSSPSSARGLEPAPSPAAPSPGAPPSTDAIAAPGSAPGAPPPEAPAPAEPPAEAGQREAPVAVAAEDEPLPLEPPLAPKSEVKPVKAEAPRPRPSRKGPTALQREWSEARRTYLSLTRLVPCQDPTLSRLCDKYEALADDVLRAGTEEDAGLRARVKRLRGDLASRLKTARLSH